jgi:hypothetical protein
MRIGAIQDLVGHIGPWFVQNQNLAKLKEVLAIGLDVAQSNLEFGLQQSQPLKCHSSSLSILAKDRALPLYPSETDSSRRNRLSRWSHLHRRRGTHRGELENMRPYLYTGDVTLRIVHQDGTGASATWHSLSTSGSYSVAHVSPSNWNYDGQPSKWSRFWAILNMPPSSVWWNAPTYGGGRLYGDGCLYGAGISTQQASDIISLLKDWKSAHSRLAGVIFSPADGITPTATLVTESSGATVMPNGNWGSRYNPSTGAPTRSRNHLWIYEDNP